MKLSVVIVSYNVRHYLVQCLDSLYRALDGVDAEVYVVDNHSKDGTPACIAAYGRGVKLIASNHNNGFARANNMAIRNATGEYVLMLNPDTLVGENTIKDCISFMDTHPEAGGVGVQMLKSDGEKALESRRGLPTPMTSLYKMCGLCAKYPANKRFGRYYMCGMSWEEPGRIDVISGAFFMTRRSALAQTGLLDEDFFMYGEDIDLSYRLLDKGFENWYLPSKILHYKGESTQKSSFRYVHVFYEAMLIFFRKHYGHLGFWLSIPIKAAIYVKATLALAKMSYTNINKMLGFRGAKRKPRPRYLFIGSAKSLDACRKIAVKNGFVADYLECDGKSNPDGHLKVSPRGSKACPVYAVYDTSAYGYGQILDIFSTRPCRHVFIGTYNPERNIIITDKEIIY